MDSFNIDQFGGSSLFCWNHKYLINVLTNSSSRVVKNKKLIDALHKVDRGDFVPEEVMSEAYNDKRVDIGFNQTMAKPTIATYMIELLSPKPGSRVLDIGTGTGWSAALISHIIGNEGKLFSLERLQYLQNQARENIEKYKSIKNIEFVFRDGYFGLPERAPYDFIHISSAYNKIPDELKDQLNIGGKLIAPTTKMSLVLITREAKNKWVENIFPGDIFDEIQKGIN